MDTQPRMAQRSMPPAKRWKFPYSQAIACLVVVAGICIFLYPHAASWFSQREQSRATELAQSQLEEPPNNDSLVRAELLQRAYAYNDALASGAMVAANTQVPLGEGSSSNDSLVYDSILDFTGTGFMGRLRYDALDIDLPIYHGTSAKTLERGVGHLEGTSLPVGGIGTRSVLTAHRGLPAATLFNDLDKAEMGDTLTVSVLDQVLSYEVVEIQVIKPEETEAILPDPERDIITLVTCTPLGINSHRILVTAERVTPTSERDLAAAQAAPDIPGFPWWAVILGLTVISSIAYIWRTGQDHASVGQFNE